MLDNTTDNPTSSFLRICSFGGNAIIQQTVAFNFVTASIAIAVAFLAPVTVIANALILSAIWKTPSLRVPYSIFLGGLALTDFFTGLISLPFYVATEFICLEEPQGILEKLPFLVPAKLIFASVGTYLSSVTVLILTFMSLERYFHMTRRSLLTGRNGIATALAILLLPIPIAVLRSLQASKGTHGIVLPICFALLLSCFVTMSLAYYKVLQIIRRHQRQIQATATSHRVPEIDVAKYKKSVYSILIIVVLFYISYFPSLVFLSGFYHSLENDHGVEVAFKFSALLVFLACSLNPLIVVWRMRDFRNAIREMPRCSVRG